MVRLEAQQLLQHGLAEHLAVVDLGGGAAPRQEFALPGRQASFGQGIVQSGVDGDYQFFQIERLATFRHGWCPLLGSLARDIDNPGE